MNIILTGIYCGHRNKIQLPGQCKILFDVSTFHTTKRNIRIPIRYLVLDELHNSDSDVAKTFLSTAEPTYILNRACFKRMFECL